MKNLLLLSALLPLAALAQPASPQSIAHTPTRPIGQLQGNTLQAELARTVAGFASTVGIAVCGVEDSDSAQVNAYAHLPMQSVYKLPLGLAVLHQVDQGRLSLDQQLLLQPADLLPNTWSPLRERYPQGNVRVPLREILHYTVSESDNNGCDILFRLLGGPAAVEAYMRSIGISQMRVVATEEEMHRREDVQYQNWATPAALRQLLLGVSRGRYLSNNSQEYLWQLLTTGPTGMQRLRAGVPAGTEVAHKTGSSGTNPAGLTAATNDAGLLMLPNGHRVVVVVFVANATASEADCERLIAAVSRVVWQYFTAKS